MHPPGHDRIAPYTRLWLPTPLVWGVLCLLTGPPGLVAFRWLYCRHPATAWRLPYRYLPPPLLVWVVALLLPCSAWTAAWSPF